MRSLEARSHLHKLVVRRNSLGGLIVEAHLLGRRCPVLFHRLDGELISQGLERRRIAFTAEVLLEDHTQGMMRTRKALLGNLFGASGLKASVA